MNEIKRTIPCQFCHRAITFEQWFSQDCEKRDGGHLCLPVAPLNPIPSIEEEPDA